MAIINVLANVCLSLFCLFLEFCHSINQKDHQMKLPLRYTIHIMCARLFGCRRPCCCDCSNEVRSVLCSKCIASSFFLRRPRSSSGLYAASVTPHWNPEILIMRARCTSYIFDLYFVCVRDRATIKRKMKRLTLIYLPRNFSFHSILLCICWIIILCSFFFYLF